MVARGQRVGGAVKNILENTHHHRHHPHAHAHPRHLCCPNHLWDSDLIDPGPTDSAGKRSREFKQFPQVVLL